MYKLGTKSLQNLIGVHPILAFAVVEAIKITKQDFTVFDGVRSMAKQKQYVAEGVSTTFNSYHLWGLAVDLVPWVNGKASWSEVLFIEIHEAMTMVIKEHNLNIDNGFDLWGWDNPHYQLTGLKSEYDIRKLSKK